MHSTSNTQNSPHKYRTYRSSHAIWCSRVATLIFLLISGFASTNAVPTDNPLLLRRAVQDSPIVPAASSMLMQEEAKDATSTEPAVDPPQAGQCLLDGVLVAETTVFCEKQVGCRAIQKTGHCCPDYKCDCEKDGKTYLNGDKLVDPATPCTVCYCKGGEILCSSVTCFSRDDCTPKYIPGRCCPEYDDCPVAKNEPSTNTTPSKPETPPPQANHNQNFTIKEITKPTEIRITNDNKAPIHQMLKSTTEAPASTSSSTTTTAAPSTTANTSSTAQPTPAEETETAKSVSTESSPTNSKDSNPAVAGGIVEVDENLEADGKVAELPFAPFQRVESDVANGSSKVNIKREYLVTSEAPTTDGVSPANAQPTLIEAIDNGAPLNALTEIEPETAGSDNIYHIILTTDGPRMESSTQGYMAITTVGIDVSSTTNNTHAQNLNLSATVPPASTTEGPINFSTSSSATSGLLTTLQGLSKDLDDYLKMSTEGMQESSSTEPKSYSTTKSTHHHTEEEDTAMPVESNPAYPSLPEDDFSLRDVNFPLTDTDDTADPDLKDEARSIHQATYKHLDERERKPSPTEGSGSGVEYSSTTELISSTTEGPSKKPEKVQLMYSAEDLSGETAIPNGSEYLLEKIMHENENETGSGAGANDSLELLAAMDTTVGSGGGSGGGDLLEAVNLKAQQREPTTPRPTKRPPTDVDIDELREGASGDGNAQSANDPKLDVESLKVEENEKNEGEKVETSAKADLLAQEKSVEELESGAHQRLKKIIKILY